MGFYRTKDGHVVDFYSKEEVTKALTDITKAIQNSCPNTQVIIQPDIEEASLIYPLPISSRAMTIQGASTINSPALVTVNDKLNIGVIGGDLVVEMLSDAHLFNFEDESKIYQILKAYIGQRHLYPLYPARSPIDLTKFDRLSLKLSDSLDILVYSSSTKLLAEVIDGVLCINTRQAMTAENSGYYASINIDAKVLSFENVKKIPILIFSRMSLSAQRQRF